MHIRPIRTVAPEVDVVTLAEVKAHLRIDHSDEDATLSLYLAAAISHFDGWTGVLGRCLINQTWRMSFEEFPADGVIDLRLADVSSVSVAYSDAADAEQTLSSSLYRLVELRGGAAIILKKNQSWPETYDRPDAVRVTLVAGYGAAANDVPPALRSAILLRAGDLYHKREDASGSGDLISMLTAPYSRTLMGAGPF